MPYTNRSKAGNYTTFCITHDLLKKHFVTQALFGGCFSSFSHCSTGITSSWDCWENEIIWKRLINQLHTQQQKFVTWGLVKVRECTSWDDDWNWRPRNFCWECYRVNFSLWILWSSHLLQQQQNNVFWYLVRHRGGLETVKKEKNEKGPNSPPLATNFDMLPLCYLESCEVQITYFCSTMRFDCVIISLAFYEWLKVVTILK